MLRMHTIPLLRQEWNLRLPIAPVHLDAAHNNSQLVPPLALWDVVDTAGAIAGLAQSGKINAAKYTTATPRAALTHRVHGTDAHQQ